MTIQTQQAPDEIINDQWASELLSELPERLSHRILEWADRAPDNEALVDDEVRWTFAELGREVRRATQWLQEQGVRPGDRIMTVGENGRALVVLVLAASELDAWVAIVNARLSAQEVDLIRDNCQPRRIFYTTAVSPEASGHAARHGAETTWQEGMGELAVGELAQTSQEAVKAAGAEQVAAMIYTSGTTGNPKGVMLSHRGIQYIAAVSAGMRRIGPGHRVYGVLPMSHVFGLASVCVGALYNGACLYPVPRFEADTTLKALVDEGISILQGVPAMFARLLERLKQRGQSLEAPELVYISTGGASIDGDLKRRVEEAFGLSLHAGYGLTEASPTVSQTRADEHHDNLTVGRVIPLMEYRLEPLGDQPLEEGVGELWVRGPNVMLGYYRQPEATRQCLTEDGWLNTGDLARFDEKGFMFIVGRSKELVIRSGFNVYPPDVEAVINEHPEVTLSAVVGRSVPGNEEVIAFVQPESGSMLDETQLRDFLAEYLAPYKRPSEIYIVDSLPATATGKILKGQLREQAQRGVSS